MIIWRNLNYPLWGLLSLMYHYLYADYECLSEWGGWDGNQLFQTVTDLCYIRFILTGYFLLFTCKKKSKTDWAYLGCNFDQSKLSLKDEQIRRSLWLCTKYK